MTRTRISCRAYYIPLEIALSTLEYLGNERDYLPWYTAWRELRFLDSVMAYHEMHNKFQVSGVYRGTVRNCYCY